MSYEKKTQSVLAGSTNTLAPGDVIPEQDALVIRNFRANTEGSLRSRQGMVLLTGFGTPPTSICRVDGGISSQRRYYGVGGSLYRNGATSVSSGFSGSYPIGLVSFQGFCWATSPARNGKDDGNYFTQWSIAAPTTAASITAGTPTGTGLTGDYDYYVTFVDQHGYESGPNPVASITLTAQKAALASIPTYTTPAGYDPGLTMYRRIYRSGGAQKNAVRIAELADNTTTTYNDEMSDVDAEEMGILFDSVNNDVAPNGIGVVGPYYDRLLIFATEDNPNRVWFSKQLQPYAFPGSSSTAGYWFDVGEKGEFILAISIRPRQIIIYKEKTIWRVAGDPGASDSVLERISDSQGIVSRKALASGGGYDFFLSPEGVMQFDGETPTKVSGKLDPFFRGEYPDTYNSGMGDPFFTPRRSQAVMGFRRGELWISVPVGDVAVNNFTWRYNPVTKKWVSDTRGFTALCDEGQNGDFLGGYVGGVASVEDNVTDAGDSIALDYEGHFSDQGQAENEKRYADLVIEANTNGASLTVSALTDNGQVVTSLGTLNTTQRKRVVFAFPDDFRGINFALKISGTVNTTGTVNGDVHLYKATLHYYVLARRGKTFDSDLTDLGTRLIKSSDYMELDIEVFDTSTGATGLVTYSILTDRPTPTGGGMAVAKTGTFGKGPRRVIRFPYTEIHGQMYRLKIAADSTTSFCLYSAGFRVLPIGVYVDGANGESFRTKEVAIGF